MSAESPLEDHDVPAALMRGEFSRIDTFIDEFRGYKPISDVDAGWFLYGGLARYFAEDFSGALCDFRQAVANAPDYIGALTNLAYLLACCPDDRIHDSGSAIEYAVRACELTNWQEWGQLQVLSAAYSRHREFTLACKYADAARKLAPEYAIWRCERLLDKIMNEQPFTGSVDEDFMRMKSDDAQANRYTK